MNILLKYIDLIIRVKYRIRDCIFYILRKPFIGSLGKGSYIKPGVRIIGNPYRIKIGAGFKIWHNCVVAVGKGTVSIGNNGLLGVGTIVNAGNNLVKIGNGVAIAQDCKIIAYSHHYFPENYIVNSYVSGDIIIEDDVLIGAGSVILPGITVGKGAVIGAGAIVVKDVEPYTIVGGIPAKFIKKRI